MFARWHNVRLRSAEKALFQGRVDDALAAILALLDPRAARAEGGGAYLAPPAGLKELLAPLVGDVRAQRLLDELASALLARARVQRQGGRYREALGDIEWVAALGRATEELSALRRQVESELEARAAEDAARQREAGERQAEAARVADVLRAGRLDSVRARVDQVDDPQQRARLAEELAVRERRAAQLLGQADEALRAGDVLLAVRLWQDACERHGETQDSLRLAARLADACRREVAAWHRAGQIGALLAARPGVERLAAIDATLADSQRLIDLAGRAVAQLSAGDHAALRTTLLRLKAGGEASWIEAALDALGRLAAAQDELLASPLGWRAGDPGVVRRTASVPGEPAWSATPTVTELVAAKRAGVEADSDPQALRVTEPLLLLVDGGGSSLLLAREQVRLGRAGASRAAADVPLPGECDAHHADIIRRDEDYFLVAYGVCRVNGRAATHVLLRDGDRVELAEGPRLTFQRPSGKSRSAVLRLSHRSRLADDVSDVVLLADTCVIGAGPHAHVRLREPLGPVVLFEARGVLHARQMGGEGHLLAAPLTVRNGQTVELGGLRFTLKPYAPGRAPN